MPGLFEGDDPRTVEFSCRALAFRRLRPILITIDQRDRCLHPPIKFSRIAPRASARIRFAFHRPSADAVELFQQIRSQFAPIMKATA